MRLPRHFNTALPQEEVVSPESAAAAAYAPGQVAAEGFGMAGELIQKVKDANDVADIAEMSAKAKLSLKEWEETDFGDDLDAMREDFQRRRGEVEAMSGTLRSRRTKEAVDTAIKSTFDLASVDAEKAIFDKSMEIVRTKGQEAVNTLELAGDFEGAANVLKGIDNAGALAEGVLEKQLAAQNNRRIAYEAAEITKGVDDAYAQSWEAGEAALSDLVAAEGMDEDVKREAVDGAQNRRVEWHTARTAQREKRQARNIVQFGGDLRQASAGNGSEDYAKRQMESGEWGDPVAAANRFNQYMAAMSASVRAGTVDLSIDDHMFNGTMMPDEKKYREAFDRKMATITEGMEPEDALAVTVAYSNTLGTLPQSWVNKLNTAGKAKANLEGLLPFYKMLTENPEYMPELHLSNTAETALEAAKVYERAGMTYEESSDLVWDEANIPEAQRISREQDYKNDSTVMADWATLQDESEFESGFWESNAEVTSEMQVEYESVHRQAYMSSGSFEVAKTIADRTIKRTWTQTNINGEPEVMKYGVPGDSTDVRNRLLTNMTGEFLIQTDEGSMMAVPDPEQIQFKSIGREGNNWIVTPMYQGVPLQDDQNEVMEVVIGPDDLQRINVSADQTRKIEKKNKEIQSIEMILNRGGPAQIHSKSERKKYQGRIDVLQQEITTLESVVLDQESVGGNP